MTDDRKGVRQTPRDTCYFCGSQGPIETHHVVPNRYGGTDGEENLVDLCPTCHERLERLYNKRFYSSLGVEKEESDEVDMGTSHEQSQRLRELRRIIEESERNGHAGADLNYVKSQMVERGHNPNAVDKDVEQLKSRGEVYSPKRGEVTLT